MEISAEYEERLWIIGKQRIPYQESIQIDHMLKSIISSFETKCRLVKKQLQYLCEGLKSKGYEKLNVLPELLEMISDAYAFTDNHTANIQWVLQER